MFAAVFANPLRSPAYSGAKSLGLLFTATAWNASKIMPTVMIVRAQITEQPMIMTKKKRPPPTKKPKNAKIRLLRNNQNVKDRVEGHFHREWNKRKKSDPETTAIVFKILWIIPIVKLNTCVDFLRVIVAWI